MIDMQSKMVEQGDVNKNELVVLIQQRDMTKMGYYHEKAHNYCLRTNTPQLLNVFMKFLQGQISTQSTEGLFCLSILAKDPKKQQMHERTVLSFLEPYGFSKGGSVCFYQGTLYPAAKIPKKLKKVKTIDLINNEKKIIVCLKHTNNLGGNQDSDAGYVERQAYEEAEHFLEKNKKWKIVFINDGDYFCEQEKTKNTKRTRLFVGGNELLQTIAKW
jgi:hypothetical protein